MLEGLTQQWELHGGLTFDQIGNAHVHCLRHRDRDIANDGFANQVVRRPNQTGHVEHEATPNELAQRL